MSPRTRNALIGLAVGLGCAAFIIVGVYQASAPSPTTVRIVNAGADAVVLRQLAVNDQVVSSAEFAVAGVQGNAAPASFTARAVELSAGRPVAVTALLREAEALSCSLAPRPQGVCVVQAVFVAGAALECSYECAAAESK